MKLTLSMLPVAMPYLAAEPARVQRWENRLNAIAKVGAGGVRKKRVGLVWAGNPAYGLDRYRSIPLNRWHAVLAQSDVQWFSLQMGRAQDEAAALPAEIDMHMLGPEINSFSDTIAIIESLHLVITVDTAVAHLAGALGATGLGDGACLHGLPLDDRPQRQSLVSVSAPVQAAGTGSMGCTVGRGTDLTEGIRTRVAFLNPL